MRELRFYRTASGLSPVEDFLDSLPGKQAQKVIWVLGVLEDLDRVPEQYFKKLSGTEDLWEVRAQQGSDAFRLLGFFDGPLLVLVSAFVKKTRKTPHKEIELAERRRRDYLPKRGRDE